MTWKTISQIICKSSSKRKELNQIIVDSKVITNKRDICDKFNNFFSNIGPELAEKVAFNTNKNSDMYLKKHILTTFSFDLVNENDTLKHMASLA